MKLFAHCTSMRHDPSLLYPKICVQENDQNEQDKKQNDANVPELCATIDVRLRSCAPEIDAADNGEGQCHRRQCAKETHTGVRSSVTFKYAFPAKGINERVRRRAMDIKSRVVTYMVLRNPMVASMSGERPTFSRIEKHSIKPALGLDEVSAAMWVELPTMRTVTAVCEM